MLSGGIQVTVCTLRHARGAARWIIVTLCRAQFPLDLTGPYSPTFCQKKVEVVKEILVGINLIPASEMLGRISLASVFGRWSSNIELGVFFVRTDRRNKVNPGFAGSAVGTVAVLFPFAPLYRGPGADRGGWKPYQHGSTQDGVLQSPLCCFVTLGKAQAELDDTCQAELNVLACWTRLILSSTILATTSWTLWVYHSGLRQDPCTTVAAAMWRSSFHTHTALSRLLEHSMAAFQFAVGPQLRHTCFPTAS